MKSYFKKRWYFFIPLIVAAIMAFGFVIVFLWNYTMPLIFNLPEITFWQAICLLILSRILFSGGGPPFSRHAHRWPGPFREKWEKMSPEEREQYYKKWNSRCYPGSFRKEETPEK